MKGRNLAASVGLMVLSVLIVVVLALPAFAQYAGTGGTDVRAGFGQPADTQVLGARISRPSTAVAGARANDALPVSGADLVQLVAIGLVSIAVGSLMSRRSHATN